MQLESIYRSVSLVGNICVHADPLRTKPIAVVVLIERELRNLIGKLGESHDSIEILATNSKVQVVVLEQRYSTGNMRILCLHGHGTSGAILKSQLGAFIRQADASYEFIFLDVCPEALGQ